MTHRPGKRFTADMMPLQDACKATPARAHVHLIATSFKIKEKVSCSGQLDKSSEGVRTVASENTTDEKKAFASFIQIVEAMNRN